MSRADRYPKFTRIAAHRGIYIGKQHQENTIPALLLAKKMKVDLIEFDVRKTKDDVWVLHHDNELVPDTDISDCRYDELISQAECLNKKIDLLEDVLHQVKKIDLNIECKPMRYEDGMALGELLRRYDTSRINVSSFFGDTLRGVHHMNHLIRLSYLGYILPFAKWKVFNIFQPLYSINPFQDFISRFKVMTAHLNRLEIHAWTINDSLKIKRLIRMGVDVIITDFPEKAMEIRQDFLKTVQK